MRGGVEWQTQHEAKPSAALDTRRHPKYCIFHTSQVNSALNDLLFCIGKISSNSSDG